MEDDNVKYLLGVRRLRSSFNSLIESEYQNNFDIYVDQLCNDLDVAEDVAQDIARKAFAELRTTYREGEGRTVSQALETILKQYSETYIIQNSHVFDEENDLKATCSEALNDVIARFERKGLSHKDAMHVLCDLLKDNVVKHLSEDQVAKGEVSPELVDQFHELLEQLLHKNVYMLRPKKDDFRLG